MKSTLYFADDQVRDAFFLLQSGKTEEKEIFNQLNTAFDMIAKDPFCGLAARVIQKWDMMKGM